MTLHPGYDLMHCYECGLRMWLDEVETVYRCDAERLVMTRHCPLRAICWFCDQVEQECDVTKVMPKVASEQIATVDGKHFWDAYPMGVKP